MPYQILHTHKKKKKALPYQNYFFAIFCCRPESTVIEEIIQWINYELDHEVPSVSEHLFGMESCVEEMLDLCLGERLDCVHFIGICGIGGIEIGRAHV